MMFWMIDLPALFVNLVGRFLSKVRVSGKVRTCTKVISSAVLRWDRREWLVVPGRNTRRGQQEPARKRLPQTLEDPLH